MEKVINLGIPHVGEQIFESIERDEDLVEFLKVSETWKIIAGKVLLKRWKKANFHKNVKDVLIKACRDGKTEILKVLLDIGDDETFQTIKEQLNETRYGWEEEPLFAIACRKGHKGVVQLLLDYHSDLNFDLNAKSSYGDTAFMLACQIGDPDVVQLMLEKSDIGIDLNAKSKDGITAFMYACMQGHRPNDKNIFLLLLNNSDKIDVNARDNSGRTAYNLAHRFRYRDVVTLLERHPSIDRS